MNRGLLLLSDSVRVEKLNGYFSDVILIQLHSYCQLFPQRDFCTANIQRRAVFMKCTKALYLSVVKFASRFDGRSGRGDGGISSHSGARDKLLLLPEVLQFFRRSEYSL